MSELKITGYGDDLTVNEMRLGDLSPQDHENIEKERQLNQVLLVETH